MGKSQIQRIVLGMHFGHDSSAVVVADGKVVAAVSEERMSRIKMQAGYPKLAVEKVLEIAGINREQVDAVAIATTEKFRTLPLNQIEHNFGIAAPLSKLKKISVDFMRVMRYASGQLPPTIGSSKLNHYEKKNFQKFCEFMQKEGFPKAKIKFYDHHKSHAASALLCSPFESAAVFTSDGRGDALSGTASWGKGNDLILKSEVSELDSVGMFYSAITVALGFRSNRHEGKITGLAAFGDSELLYDQFIQLFNLRKGESKYTFSLPGEKRPRDPMELSQLLAISKLSITQKIKIMSMPNFEIARYVFKWHNVVNYLSDIAALNSREDVAAAAQRVAEEVIVNWVANFVGKDSADVVVAGGLFANVKINEKILQLSSVKNIYVHPAMGDDGIALGAALLDSSESMLCEAGEKARASQLDHVYLGSSYSYDEIIAACNKEGVYFQKQDNISESVAELLHLGKVVGRFAGRMEWGPRALGNRSILICPTDASINTTINQRLNRTEFMPFAPSILHSKASDYLIGWAEDHVAADFMTVTYSFREEQIANFSAVVHVDGTARPQIVRKETNKQFFSILEAYHKISGLGGCVNTSFNAHEEPIVESPLDAIRALKADCVDVLAIEDFLVTVDPPA